MKSRALEMQSFLWVYGALFIVSALGDYGLYGHFFGSWRASAAPSLLGVFLVAIFSIFYLLLSSFASRIFRWAIELDTFFRGVLTPLSYLQIIVLSVVSGFLEEWFFRGILVTHFGVVISSLIFGLAHFLPSRGLWVWSLWSFFFGLVFGWIYLFTESLWLVAILHFLINFLILLKLNASALRSPAIT